MAHVVERLIGPLPEFHRNAYRLTAAIRIEIIRIHGSGVGKDTIAWRLNINKKSVQLWIKRYNEKRNLEPQVNADGRPSLTTEDETFLLACYRINHYRVNCIMVGDLRTNLRSRFQKVIPTSRKSRHRIKRYALFMDVLNPQSWWFLVILNLKLDLHFILESIL
jgi:hypothetical protein